MMIIKYMEVLNMETLVVIGFLLAFIVFSEIRNYYERKGLLNRIMSRNYVEYSSHEISKEQLKAQVRDGSEEYVTL